MSNLQLFQFNSSEVRIVVIEGEPWFVAKDLCEILAISKHRDAISRLDDDERGLFKLDTPGGKQDMTVVSESGMFGLVLSSRKPEAKEFKKWIRSEVLPSIRKTGGYISTQGKTKLQILAETFQQMVDLEEKQKAQGLKLVEHDDILQEHGQTITELSNEMDRYTDGDGHYMTIIGYANLNKIKVDRNYAKSIGIRCSKLYRDKFHKEPPKVSDGRFGSVNSYPKDIINKVFLDLSKN
jgi:prophage antirepressor-like protein